MRFFHIHPHDSQWLRRWLRAQAFCVVVLVCVLLAMRASTPERLKGEPEANRIQANSVALEQMSRPISVAPEGWRRTRNGWEHVSTWRSVATRPLAEIIESQRQAEPAWIQAGLLKIREVPPLMFALIQITSIAVIVNVLREEKVSPKPLLSRRE